ncbi:MAG: GspH/FimT family pseudopilin [Deltaproteobacteria bacterium]|nr:GspH/FimT family pseudopilin [Deltaproteobacteria bacterium]
MCHERTGRAAAATGRQAGFSFIEVVVTAAIVSLLAATAVPRIPVMLATYDLTEATQEVALDLRLARARAITSNGHARLQFDGQTYTRQRESTPGSGAYVSDGAPQDLPGNVTVTTNPATPTFDSRGLTTQPYTVTFTSSYGSTKTITVTTIGRINVG